MFIQLIQKRGYILSLENRVRKWRFKQIDGLFTNDDSTAVAEDAGLYPKDGLMTYTTTYLQILWALVALMDDIVAKKYASDC